MTTINKTDFDFVRDLVYQRSAIVLDPGKEYLVQARLLNVAQNQGCSSLGELVSRLRTQPVGGLHQKVIEAITTNETSFFRDFYPFEALRKVVVPEILAKRALDQRLTIWCGAASTGQEPYSLAITLMENFPNIPKANLRIIATDINTEVLEQARRGIYSQIEVNRGLPAALLVRYFEKVGTSWQVREDIRKMVEFRECNLIGNWPLLPPVDVLMLRNVLIYFDTETKKTILAKARKVMRPDGVLFLGGAESTLNLDDSFERMALERTTAYRIRKAA